MLPFHDPGLVALGLFADMGWVLCTSTLDCEYLALNIGDACNDGASTENDAITADCECAGTVVYDCPELEVNNGESCSLDGLQGVYVDCACEITETGSPGGHVADLLDC